MKGRIVKAMLSAFVLIAVAGVSYTAGAMQSGKAVMTPIGSVKWEPYAPGNPLQIGMLWGDRTKGGEYGMLLKIPAGFDSGPHSHTADYHALAVQGQWAHSNAGDKQARDLPVGSFVYQPGKTVHTDLCKSKTECIVFIHQHGAGDFIPAKTP
jgi:hypothetical protein